MNSQDAVGIQTDAGWEITSSGVCKPPRPNVWFSPGGDGHQLNDYSGQVTDSTSVQRLVNSFLGFGETRPGQT